MDTKLDGIPASVLAAALNQAKEARLYILDVMNGAIDEPDEMSETAPRIISLNIPVDKIGEVIYLKVKLSTRFKRTQVLKSQLKMTVLFILGLLTV